MCRDCARAVGPVTTAVNRKSVGLITRKELCWMIRWRRTEIHCRPWLESTISKMATQSWSFVLEIRSDDRCETAILICVAGLTPIIEIWNWFLIAGQSLFRWRLHFRLRESSCYSVLWYPRYSPGLDFIRGVLAFDGALWCVGPWRLP